MILLPIQCESVAICSALQRSKGDMKTQAITWLHSKPANVQRRVVLVDVYWTRDKDPRVPLGHGCLLAALRADPAIDARSVVLPVNSSLSATDIAAEILAETV